MGHELALVMSQIEHTKRIDKKQLIEAIQSALSSSAKKILGAGREVDVEFDEVDTEFRAFYLMEVVSEVLDPGIHMTVSEAQKLKPGVAVGDVVRIPIPAEQFGRIAAQTAKQVIVQKIQDAERQSVYDQYKDKEGELVTGSVLRYEGRNLIVSLGEAEALLPYKEQVPRERYSTGERMKFLVLEVRKVSKGPAVVVSRAHPGLVRKLFELEVPEIYEGTVKIESTAREPGARTKISVRSASDERIDAVGACVGVKGTRVQAVVDEIRGEKVDIVRWDEDPHSYLGNSLSPAKIARIVFHPEDSSAEIIVNKDQLSLAIGKKGQNARLAAKLTGIRIDIKSDEQYALEERARMDAQFAQLSDTPVDESTDPAAEAEVQAAGGIQVAPPEPLVLDEGKAEEPASPPEGDAPPDPTVAETPGDPSGTPQGEA